MLVGFTVPMDPRVEFAFVDRKPPYEPFDRDFGFIAPCPGKINNGVSRIMGNPDAG